MSTHGNTPLFFFCFFFCCLLITAFGDVTTVPSSPMQASSVDAAFDLLRTQFNVTQPPVSASSLITTPETEGVVISAFATNATICDLLAYAQIGPLFNFPDLCHNVRALFNSAHSDHYIGLAYLSTSSSAQNQVVMVVIGGIFQNAKGVAIQSINTTSHIVQQYTSQCDNVCHCCHIITVTNSSPSGSMTPLCWKNCCEWQCHNVARPDTEQELFYALQYLLSSSLKWSAAHQVPPPVPPVPVEDRESLTLYQGAVETVRAPVSSVWDSISELESILAKEVEWLEKLWGWFKSNIRTIMTVLNIMGFSHLNQLQSTYMYRAHVSQCDGMRLEMHQMLGVTPSSNFSRAILQLPLQERTWHKTNFLGAVDIEAKTFAAQSVYLYKDSETQVCYGATQAVNFYHIELNPLVVVVETQTSSFGGFETQTDWSSYTVPRNMTPDDVQGARSFLRILSEGSMTLLLGMPYSWPDGS